MVAPHILQLSLPVDFTLPSFSGLKSSTPSSSHSRDLAVIGSATSPNGMAVMACILPTLSDRRVAEDTRVDVDGESTTEIPIADEMIFSSPQPKQIGDAEGESVGSPTGSSSISSVMQVQFLQLC